MTEHRVIVTREAHVADVLLHRPAKRNGLDRAMFEELTAAGEALADDPTVRAVVLRGEGPSFCAGLDFMHFAMHPTDQQVLLERRPGKRGNLAQRVAVVWQDVPVPVICAIHGACLGGGLQIALGADIRIVHPEATLSVREVRMGLVPDMGITQTAPGVVPLDVLKELTFTARDVTGAEAQRLGLATRVADEPQAEAFALARTIAERSPRAVRRAKRLFREASILGPDDALRFETELQLELLGSPEQLEAVSAQMAKRPPRFD